MKPRRRTVFLALSLSALVTLASCSDDRAVETSSTPSAPAVIRVSGTSTVAGAQGLAAPEMAGDAVGGADRKAAWWGVTEYQLAGELPALDSPVDGWRYSPRSDLDREGANRVATAFGLSGEPLPLPADWGAGWRIGPDDGTAPALMFSADALGGWSYSAPWTHFREAELVADDEGSVKPVEMAPPVGVPDVTEANRLAVELMGRLGIEMTTLDLEVYADEWGAWVTGWYVLDGQRTGYAVSVGFGENAAVTWASGYMNTPERVTGFARVGTAKGFERLTSNSGLWWGGTVARTPGVAMPYPEGGVGEQDAPPVITVQIVGVKEAWWTIYDVDGSMWVVPGYSFIDADGGEYLVPAVADELIQPVDLPAPTETPVSDGGGSSTPGYDPDAPVSDEVVQRLIGLSEDAAQTLAKELGFEMRVTERDGEQFPATADYRVDRVNVVITAGVVTASKIG
jgi:hypothetical protein